jgi:hypothetical protein
VLDYIGRETFALMCATAGRGRELLPPGRIRSHIVRSVPTGLRPTAAGVVRRSVHRAACAGLLDALLRTCYYHILLSLVSSRPLSSSFVFLLE